MILSGFLCLLGAAIGYFAVSEGWVFGAGTNEEHGSIAAAGESAPGGALPPLPEVEYIPLDPIIVTLDFAAEVQHLRFRGELEVLKPHRAEVESVLPRVIDVLNTYLRALEVRDFADPMALARLRAQMLRRIQVVTGTGRVNDLMIMDFVLN